MQLDSEERALNGIPYRFMWDNTAGVIKILTYGHDMVTLNITRQLDRLCVAMGIDGPVREFVSGGTTTRLLCGGSKGKEPDGCVLPSSRLKRDRESWPSLVIEAGVPASLPRLREEARWWLRNSQGEVRMVLVLGTDRQNRKLIIEKWEQQERAPIQPEGPLQAHAAQTIEIGSESESGSGAPLVLPFEEFVDRPRQGKETDIVPTEERLRESMHLVWELS